MEQKIDSGRFTGREPKPARKSSKKATKSKTGKGTFTRVPAVYSHSKTTSAAKKHIVQQLISTHSVLVVPATSITDHHVRVICTGCLESFRLENMDVDHAQPKADINARQKEMLRKINSEKGFKETILAELGQDKFDRWFIPNGEETYAGSTHFYNDFYNDVNNLWLLCKPCNEKKSDRSFSDYLKENRQLTQLDIPKDQLGILKSTRGGEGLGKSMKNLDLLSFRQLLTLQDLQEAKRTHLDIRWGILHPRRYDVMHIASFVATTPQRGVANNSTKEPMAKRRRRNPVLCKFI